MARIGILTCRNATQGLGCPGVACMADFRKRRGAFAAYPADQPLDLIGVVTCPGCPTLVGADRIVPRVRGLAAFRADAIHFSNCIKALCPFREKYRQILEAAFPEVQFVLGTHAEHISDDEFRNLVQGLFAQPGSAMVDLMLPK